MSNIYQSLKTAKQSNSFPSKAKISLPSSKQFFLLFTFIILHLFGTTPLTATERVSFKEATYGSLPNSFGQVFMMPTDGKAVSYTIADCSADNSFISDGSILYADDEARQDTLSICPQNQWQTIKISFEKFDINTSDSLSVYDGNLTALRDQQAPFIESANGYGASAAFGAWIQASCEGNTNPSGCLTFVFKTNGDYNKGTGWNTRVTCEDKNIELSAPNIASQVWCGEYFDVLTIGGPTVTSSCNAIDDETIVKVYSNGKTCINATVSKSRGKTITQTFAVGVYSIEYTLKSDPTKTVSTVFSVGDPSLTCNDRINISMGSACGSNLTPDMITENHCDPIPGIMHYEIVVKDNFGNIIASGGKDGNYPYIHRDLVDFCGDKTYTAEIKRVYFADYTPAYCNNGVQTYVCHTELVFQDKTPPAFQAYTPTDIVYNCNIQLTEEGLKDFTPTIIDNCNYKSASFHSATEVSATSNCDKTYLITWKAEDQCGNVAYLERTLEIRRPGLDKIVKVPDVFLSCGEDAPEAINDYSKTGTLGLKVGYHKNGSFHVTDTIALSADAYVCDYIITITDKSFPSDCGSKTFRSFELLDWCNNTAGVIPIDTQLIKFVDTIAPKIQCSPHGSLAMAEQIRLPAHTCATTPNFAPPTAIDKCDPNVTVSMFTVDRKDSEDWNTIGTNFDHTGALECGTYRVGWRAFDTCQEQIKEDTCYRYFIIEDKIAPSAICKDQLNVSIGTDYAKILATDIDGGSNDACGINQLYVRRTLCSDTTKWAGEENTYLKEKYNNTLDPIGWKEFVSVECCDLHQMVKLELLVIDNKGNFNFCWVDIRPEDKLSPTCSYLPAQTAYCDELHADELGQSTDTNNNGAFDYDEWISLEGTLLDYYNSEFGDPLTTCTDNLDCNNLSMEQEYQMIDLNCGQLQVKRRFRAVDWKDNYSNWGEQIITVNYRADWSITLPVDWVGNCGSSIPDSDLEISKGLCDKIAYEVSDQVFQTVAGSCFKVIRTFNIINWCKFNPDASIQEIHRIENNGIVGTAQTITSADWGQYSQLSYTQVLEVRDTEAPVISLEEVEECIIGDGCDGVKYFSATATDCNIASTDLLYYWEIFKDDSSIGSGTGNLFEWIVFAGPTYKVKWSVGDQCGNTAWEEQVYSFKDCKAPSPYCSSGVTIALMETGTIDIWASDFDLGSYDNCTSNEELDIRLYHESVGNQPSNVEEVLQLTSSVDFDCNYVGTQIVGMYVIDAYNNWDYCSTTVIIQDNQDACNSGQVAGKIYMADGTAVENTEVMVEGIGTMPSPYMTGTSGSYDFEIDMGGDYTVRPQKDVHPRNGVSTFDLVLLNKHILGIALFDSPYEYIAADANKSNSITAYDMVILRQLILGIIEEFPTNTSWRFVPAGYEFLTANPLSEPFLEYIVINDMPAAMTDLDFVAIKVGDVSGNANANSLTVADNRSTGSFDLSITDQNVQKGDTFTVPIYPENIESIVGYQFTLLFKDLTLIHLEEGIAKANNFGMQLTDRGYITTSWNSLPNSSTYSQTTKRKPLFQLTFEAEKEGQLKDFLSINSDITKAAAYSEEGDPLGINLTISPPLDKGLSMRQNTPNPFTDQTQIEFTISKSSFAQFTIMDMQGMVIYKQDINAQKGNNTISLQRHLPTGTYFYQLATSIGTQTKKMIVLK